jgi:hypothetical protein
VEVEFRAEINFDSFGRLTGIAFDEFLPIVEHAVPVSFGQTEFRVAIAMDPTKHRGWVSDVDLNDLGRHHGLTCSGMYILIWADLGVETAEAVTAGRTNEDTRTLGDRLLETIEGVHDVLIDLVRNERQQVQIEPRHSSEASLQQRLMVYNTRWRCPEGWKLFCAESNVVSITVELSSGISPEDWQRLRDGLQCGKFAVRPHRRLLANAFAHHEKHDLRAAMIEGVAAWEMVMSDEAVRRLIELRVGCDERDWKNLIEKAGLRASTRLFITLAQQLPELTARREEILEAIDLRNNIIHNGQQRIDRSRAKELLEALRTGCFSCEDAATRSSPAETSSQS